MAKRNCEGFQFRYVPTLCSIWREQLNTGHEFNQREGEMVSMEEDPVWFREWWVPNLFQWTDGIPCSHSMWPSLLRGVHFHLHCQDIVMPNVQYILSGRWLQVDIEIEPWTWWSISSCWADMHGNREFVKRVFLSAASASVHLDSVSAKNRQPSRIIKQ